MTERKDIPSPYYLLRVSSIEYINRIYQYKPFSKHTHTHTHTHTHKYIHIHTYIYIYIMIPLMVRKNPASDLKMKIYNESLSRGKIYILEKKKEKANLVIPIEKSQKTRNWLVKRKRNTVRAAKLQCKKCSILSSAKYSGLGTLMSRLGETIVS